MYKRIYIEASIIVRYVEMKMENTRDLANFFREELRKLRDLRSKYSFVILESSIGEAIGQCLVKGWKIREVFDYPYEFLWETRAEVVRSEVFDEVTRDELYKVFERGRIIIKSEWNGENPWGMDIYDIWFLSQVSLDPKARYVWAIDRRMLDYGATYLEIVCGRKIDVVESLRGIK